MALFTDKRELSSQARNHKFENTQGILKTTSLALLGYNPDGTKNTWGKTIGGSTPVGHYLAKEIATGDSKEVIDSAEGEVWNSTLATAFLATNFIGLGGGSKAASAATNSVGNAATQTATNSVGKNITQRATNTLANTAIQVGKDRAMQKLNDSYSEQNKSGETNTAEGSGDLSEGDMIKYQKYMDENPEGTIEDFQSKEGIINSEQTDIDKKEKNVESWGKAASYIPIVGDVANVIAARKGITNKLEDTKKEISSRSYKTEFNYL